MAKPNQASAEEKPKQTKPGQSRAKPNQARAEEKANQPKPDRA